MLDVRSVSRSYGDFKAVDDVSFTVERGEIVGLLGHNGAGKTTIMKMLSGYLEPDSGSIDFNGTSIVQHRQQLQRELGYLPENLPVYPELSVASFLDYAAELKGIRGDDKRRSIRHVIEATELGDRLLSPIATLSRGLKQRVGVAQAILGQPTLLILDEPTNGLDPTQTELMRALIRRISESATIILSTHIMQEVEAVCDRALIVRRGQLAVDAALADLKRGNRIRLSSTTDLAALQGVLDTQPWLTSVAPLPRPDEFLLSLDGDQAVSDAIAEIVRLLVGAGVPVQGIQPDVRDLQSLFLEVNADHSATAAGAAETGVSASAADANETDDVSGVGHVA